MESKTDRTSNTIGNILQVTKSTIQQTQNYYNYYINKDNDLYRKQLPFLIHKYNMQALAIRRKEIEKNVTEVGIIPYSTNEDNTFLTPLNNIRNPQIRSKKLPPLCPFYNKKGELVPSVVNTSKIQNKLNLTDAVGDISLGKIRLNKSPKIDRIPGLTNVEINFDDFQSDYFYEPEYSSLEYLDCEIYGKKDYYLELIKNKVNEFKTMEMDDVNLDSMKGRLFDRNKKTNISLKFDSISVKIYETVEEKIEDENENENENEVQTRVRDVQVFEYNLPFFFLPLFYLKGEEKFKIFLSKVILWDNVNKKFKLCESPERDFIDILKNCVDFNKEEKKEEEKKEEKPEEPQPKPSKSKYSLTMGKKSFKSQFAGFKFGGLNSTISEEQNLAQTMAGPNPGMYLTTLEERQKKLDIVFTSNIYPNKKEYNYINYNIFEFLWITERKNFKVCINTPLITVNIPSNNIQVRKYIDFELLFYLYEKDFKNWDFYLVKYLSSFKSFRTLLEQINSINECSNKSFYLSQPRVKNYLFHNIKIINIATIKYRDVLKNLIDGLMGIPEENDAIEDKTDKKKDDKNKPENKNDKKEESKETPKEEIKEAQKDEEKTEEKKEEPNNEVENENKDDNEENKEKPEKENNEEVNKDNQENENNEEVNKDNQENENNEEVNKENQENENNEEVNKDNQENENNEEVNKDNQENENNEEINKENQENQENENNKEENKEPQENVNHEEETKNEEDQKNEEGQKDDEVKKDEEEKKEEQKEENKEEIKKENHEDNCEKKEKDKEEDKKDENVTAEKEDEIINSTFVQKCFIAIVRFVDTKTYKAHEYKIYFNFSQFQKFQKMERYIDKISFLIKFININHLKKIVTMDYKALDSFDEDEWIRDFNKYNVSYLKTMDNVTNSSFEYRRTSAEYVGMIKNSVIQIEIYTPLSLARILNEACAIKTEKVFLNNNYQDDIMSVQKDNILDLSKIFYDCYEEEQNQKK